MRRRRSFPFWPAVAIMACVVAAAIWPDVAVWAAITGVAFIALLTVFAAIVAVVMSVVFGDRW